MRSKEYWVKRAEARTSLYYKKADALEKALKEHYGKAYEQLEYKLMKFMGKDKPVTYSQRRVLLLMRELAPHLDKMNTDVITDLQKFLGDTFEESYYRGIFDIFQGMGVGFSFTKVDDKLVKSVLNFPWSGDNFVDRLGDNNKKLITVLRQELTQSMIQGKALSKTTSIVSKRLEIGYKNTKRIVQTETAYVLEEANKQAFQNTGLEQYEFVSTLDNKTSPICQSMDGKVFPVAGMQAGVNASPMHPHCRSTEVPHFDDLVGERFARSLETGKGYLVPADVNFEEWMHNYVA